MPAKAPQTKRPKAATKPKVLKFESQPTTGTRVNPLTAFLSQPAGSASAKVARSQEWTNKDKDKGKGKATAPVAKQNASDTALWVDMYEPRTEAELAVHSRKVEEVRRWLNEAFEGGPSGKLMKYRKILAMTGPAGAAKTTTLRVLSNDMGFDIMEWRNSFEEFSANSDSDSYESLFTKFHSFISRAATCNSSLFSSKSSRRQVILLEDLPNILHDETRAKFHSVLESLVTLPHSAPVVMIISDTGIRGEAEDEGPSNGWNRYRRESIIDVRSALPKSLLGGPYVTEVKFNPIAPTLMRKALQAMLNSHFPTFKSSGMAPSKEALDIIVESTNGDIRSAMMALQFASLTTVSDRSKGIGRSKKARGSSTRAMLEVVTKREHSLVLFHLLGKILYNKRKGDPSGSSASAKDVQREKDSDAKLTDPPKLPFFLQEHDRPASRVDVDMLYADSPIDSSLLSLYIQQNYPQFCNDIEQCADIAQWLSWVDSSGGEAWYQANPHRFHLLSLGTLHSLPTPVERKFQKFYKPYFFEHLNKERDASFAVRGVQDWLIQERSSVSLSKATITTELGAVLNCRDGIPPSHALFTHLPFAFGGGYSQVLQEGDPVPDNDDTKHRLDELQGLEHDKEEGNGGWLEGDDIEEF